MYQLPTFIEFSDRNGKNDVTVSAMEYVGTLKSKEPEERVIMLPDLNIKETDLLKYLRDRYSLNINKLGDE